MNTMKILVIGAHPADPIDLAGGTIYKHCIEALDDIVIATLTDGVRSHTDEQWKQNRIRSNGKFHLFGDILQAKRQEFESAGTILNADDFHYFGWQDEPLVIDHKIIEYVVNYIRIVKPDIVITHHPNEYAHWDHSKCGEIVCRALKSAVKLEGDKWYVPTVYFFAGSQFRPEVVRLGYMPQAPDVLIDLDQEAIEAKIEAMMCFESQGLNDRDKLWERMNSFESEIGRADGLEYAESFSLYHPLKCSTLPCNTDRGFYI